MCIVTCGWGPSIVALVRGLLPSDPRRGGGHGRWFRLDTDVSRSKVRHLNSLPSCDFSGPELPLCQEADLGEATFSEGDWEETCGPSGLSPLYAEDGKGSCCSGGVGGMILIWGISDDWKGDPADEAEGEGEGCRDGGCDGCRDAPVD